MGIRGGAAGELVEQVLQKAIEQIIIQEVAEAGYAKALDMCGNNGQRSIIELTGYEAFEQAVRAHADDMDGRLVLTMAAPHPEAVVEILDETYEEMQDNYDLAMDIMEVVL